MIELSKQLGRAFQSSLASVQMASASMLRLWRARSNAIFWVGAIALAFVSVAGFGGLWHHSLELFSHFRLQYALCAFVAGIVAWWNGHRLATAISCGCLLLNAALVFSVAGWTLSGDGLNAREARRAAGDVTRLRLLHANVLMSNRRYESFARLVRESDPDLWFVQEVDAAWLAFLQREFARDYPHSIAEPLRNRFGIAAFSKRPFRSARILRTGPVSERGDQERDERGPSLELRLEPGPEGRDLRLYSSHPPPPLSAAAARARNLQIRELLQIADQDSGPYVLIGDLNNTPHSPWFADWLARSRLIRPASRVADYTWPTWFPGPGIEIDHCLSSDGVRVTRRRPGPHIGSDHLPLICDIQIPSNG